MLLPEPVKQFSKWYDDAKACSAIEQANAMCLSTLDLKGYPDGRMVLLKGFDERGFVFFTNLTSVKGKSMAKLARAALTFHWDPLKRQVRIQGDIERVSDQEADAYWVTRPRISQLGAWASLQSQPMDNQQTFIQRIEEVKKRFAKKPVPRPPHWTGLRLEPQRIEFWRERRGRLHERFEYRKSGKQWRTARLYP